MYHSESLDSRNVHKGDGREIQDQAVEVHSGNTDACSKLFDSLESFIPLLQNFQGVKSNLKQPNVGIRVNSSKVDCRGAEKTRAVRTASLSLSLKNSILAKKIGEGILKIFTPFGSYI